MDGMTEVAPATRQPTGPDMNDHTLRYLCTAGESLFCWPHGYRTTHWTDGTLGTLDPPTGMAADVRHCGQPMRWQSGRASWEGPPGGGGQVDDIRYCCDRCGTVATFHVRTPDAADNRQDET